MECQALPQTLGSDPKPLGGQAGAATHLEPAVPLPSLGAAAKSLPEKVGGAADGGAKARTAARSKGPEWTPWKDRITKNGHKDAVLFVAVLNARSDILLGMGQGLLTAAADGSVRLFELSSAGSQPSVRERLALQPPAASAGAVPGKCSFCTAFTCSGRPVATALDRAEGHKESGGYDLFAGYECGRVVGWRAAGSGEAGMPVGEAVAIADLMGHEGTVMAVRSCRRSSVVGDEGDRVALVSAASDGAVRAWALEPSEANVDDRGVQGGFGGHCLFALDFGPRNPVADLVLLPNSVVLACSWDGAIRCLDLRKRCCTGLTQASQVGLRALCVARAPGSSAPGEEAAQVFAGADDGDISGWHFSKNGVMAKYGCGSWKAHYSIVTAIRPWNTFLVTASEDRTIRLWIMASATLVEEFRGHAGAILALSISDRDRLVWSGARDWTIRSWDLAEAELRFWEREQLAKADAESLAQEMAARAQARALRKAKKKPPRKASEGRRKR